MNETGPGLLLQSRLNLSRRDQFSITLTSTFTADLAYTFSYWFDRCLKKPIPLFNDKNISSALCMVADAATLYQGK
jgi:hypothetical protein